jgi:hypothetical protein
MRVVEPTCLRENFEMGSVNNILSRRELIFQPWFVLVSAFVGAALYGGYMLRSRSIQASTFDLSGSFLYVVPIVVPFVAFLFDRAERFPQLNLTHYIVDLFVVGIAMGRVIGNVPYISGHTLFLSYAILSSRSIVVRITAALVLAQALYLKYFIWHDWITSTSGIVIGLLAAFSVSRFGWKSQESTELRLDNPDIS